VSVADEKLEPVKTRWAKAHEQLQGEPEHTSRDVQGMGLDEANTTVKRSFAMLKERSTIAAQFGRDNWFVDACLGSMIQISYGKPRATEIGTTQLKRGLAGTRTRFNLYHHQQHDLQDAIARIMRLISVK
jgi:hypothetical protein